MRARFLLALVVLLAGCTRPATDGAAGNEIPAPRKLTGLRGLVMGELPARTVVCNPDMPYLGPNFGSDKGTNPLVMPIWLPKDVASPASGQWIQFDLTIDWSQNNPLQMEPGMKTIDGGARPAKCPIPIIKPI